VVFLARIVALFVLLTALVGGPFAQPANAGPPAFTPTEEQLTTITRVERYMTALRTLQARFVQNSANGFATGQLYMQRPGLLRLDYEQPLHHQIIADGTFLFFWDDEVKGVSQTTLNDTLVDLIVRSRTSLTDGVTLLALGRENGVLSVTLTSDKEPGIGSLSLMFSESPFQLLGWRTHDAQGTETEVRLLDLRVGLPLDRELFYFYPPKS
jgi:outer membrane lipoprotein-sorting protein